MASISANSFAVVTHYRRPDETIFIWFQKRKPKKACEYSLLLHKDKTIDGYYFRRISEKPKNGNPLPEKFLFALYRKAHQQGVLRKYGWE